MKSIKLIILFLFCNVALAQIDAGLLLGLTNATSAQMNAITNPATGSLIYNTTDKKVYQYNGITWEAINSASNSGWNLSGNSITSSATNFIGTTNAQDVVLKANNTEKLRLVNNKGQVLVNSATSFNNHPLVVRANGVDVLAFEDNTGTPKWHWNLLSNGLNFVESNVLDYRLFLENGGNIGINTNDPTERLDVNGTARIRTLNSSSNTDQIITADNSGVLHKSKINYGARWTNASSTANLNTNNTLVPIFGNEDYKDDGNNLYELISSTQLRVKESGRYDIRANLYLQGVNVAGNLEQRTNVNARIYVDGSPVGAMGASAYIRWASSHDHSSLHLNEILQLNANQVVTIVAFREANSGTVYLGSANQSSFSINKIK